MISPNLGTVGCLGLNTGTTYYLDGTKVSSQSGSGTDEDKG